MLPGTGSLPNTMVEPGVTFGELRIGPIGMPFGYGHGMLIGQKHFLNCQRKPPLRSNEKSPWVVPRKMLPLRSTAAVEVGIGTTPVIGSGANAITATFPPLLPIEAPRALLAPS